MLAVPLQLRAAAEDRAQVCPAPRSSLLRTGRAVAGPQASPALPVCTDSSGHLSEGLDLSKLVQVHKLLSIISPAGWSLADGGCLLLLGLIATAG